MELWAHEINHVLWFWCKWVNLCDCISWTLSSMDMELVPLDTAGIEVYKNMFKRGDILITFGVVSPWSKLCFMVVDVVIILCDHISWTLQLMDVELVPLETPIYKDVLKYSDIHIRFGTASPWNQSCFVVLYIQIPNFVWPYLLNPTTRPSTTLGDWRPGNEARIVLNLVISLSPCCVQSLKHISLFLKTIAIQCTECMDVQIQIAWDHVLVTHSTSSMSIGCRVQEIRSHKVRNLYVQNHKTWLISWACSSKSDVDVTVLQHILINGCLQRYKFHVHKL